MTKDELQEMAATGGRHVGDIIMWSLKGNVRQSAATAAMDRFGLADDLRLPRINTNSVYRRAVRGAVVGGTLDKRALIVNEVEDGVSYLVHEFLSTEVVEDGVNMLTDKSTKVRHEVTVRFDKIGYAAGQAPEKLLEVEDASHPVAQRVVDTYRANAVDLVFTSNDIRIGFQRAFEHWGGLSLIDHGGAWFIPAPYAGKVRAWRDFLAAIGSSAKVIPQFDSSELLAEMSTSAEDTLETQLTRIMEELQEFAEKGNVKASTLEKRIEQFDELRSHAELYERLLDTTLSSLRERVDAAQTGLVTALRSIQ